MISNSLLNLDVDFKMISLVCIKTKLSRSQILLYLDVDFEITSTYGSNIWCFSLSGYSQIISLHGFVINMFHKIVV